MSFTATITGRVARVDPISFTSSGTARLSLSIATSKPRKTPEGKWEDGPTTFVPAVAWRHVAEAIAETDLAPGTEVTITGDIAERAWTTKDGSERKQLELTIKAFAVNVTGRQTVTVRRVDRSTTGSSSSSSTSSSFGSDDPWASA